MITLSDERRHKYHFIKNFIETLSEIEKRDFQSGEFRIDEHHAFYVKNTEIFSEIAVHSELTDHSLLDNVGAILLMFTWSNSNNHSENSPTASTYNLFLELSEGEDTTSKSKIQVIDSLLWMHSHNYVHLDIYNNNMFKLGTIMVIADFGTSAHTDDITIKFQEISHFYDVLPKTKTSKFKNLFTTILNGGKQVEYSKCGDKLIGILDRNIDSSIRQMDKYNHNPELRLEYERDLTTYRKISDECNTILGSPELLSGLYDEYVIALNEIKLTGLGIIKSKRKSKRPNKAITRRHRH